MQITVNNNIYDAIITGCGEAITLFDADGHKITTIPREKDWKETATAAITCIAAAQERAAAA